jgi:hypothetical protein
VLQKYHIRVVLTFDLKNQLHHKSRSKITKRRRENEKVTPKKCVRFVLTESRGHSYQRAALKSQQEIQDIHISERVVGYINWLLFLYIEMEYNE